MVRGGGLESNSKFGGGCNDNSEFGGNPGYSEYRAGVVKMETKIRRGGEGGWIFRSEKGVKAKFPTAPPPPPHYFSKWNSPKCFSESFSIS